MNKIYVHIFSFDRPAQLNLLLDSIAEYDKQKRFLITVQYCFSKEAFFNGYEILKLRFPKINFINEKRYKNSKRINPFFGSVLFNVLLWLRNKRFRYAGSNFRKLLTDSVNTAATDYCMFLTDDSLFYSDIEIDENLLSLILKNVTFSYSLALGTNISDGPIVEEKGWFFCDLVDKESGSPWTYPFSVDGRIYGRKYMLNLLERISFSNPNTFESVMVLFNRYLKGFKKVYFNKKSALIGFELNRVQQVYMNNSLGYDAEKINKYYLKGYFLKIHFNMESVSQFRPEIIKLTLQRNGEVVIL